MATVHDLAFASSSLRVAYRATAEAQDVDVEVILTGAPFLSTAFMVMRRLLSTINSGGASGATFAPTAGFGEQLSGPIDDRGPDGVPATIHVHLDGEIDLAKREALEDLAYLWLGAINSYSSERGEVVNWDPNHTLPYFGQNKRE